MFGVVVVVIVEHLALGIAQHSSASFFSHVVDAQSLVTEPGLSVPVYVAPFAQISSSGGMLKVVIELHFAFGTAQHVEASSWLHSGCRQLNNSGFGLSVPVYVPPVQICVVVNGVLVLVIEEHKAVFVSRSSPCFLPVVGLINVLNINATKSIVTCTIIFYERIRYQRCTVKLRISK